MDENNSQSYQTGFEGEMNVNETSYYQAPPDNRITEKRELRRVSNIMGGALLFLAAVTNLWAYAYYFVMEKIGYSVQQAYKMVSEPAILQCVQIALSMFLFTVPFIFAARKCGYQVNELVEFKKTDRKKGLYFFFIGNAFCVLANLIIAKIGDFLQNIGISYNVDTGDDPKGFFGFMLAFLATAVLPAFVEEFACRGVVLGALKKFGFGFGIIASALIFGFMHGNFEQMPFTFLVGLILAYIAVKTGSLVVCVAVHFVNNFISVAFVYFFTGFTDEIQNVIGIIIYSVILILGIVGFIKLSNMGEDFKVQKSGTKLKEKEKLAVFVTSPMIVIFLIVCLAEAIRYFFI